MMIKGLNVIVTTSARPKCSTCPFWYGFNMDPSPDVAKCLISPPRAVPYGNEGVRPLVNAGDTCGMHPDYPNWIKEQQDRKSRPDEAAAGPVMEPASKGAAKHYVTAAFGEADSAVFTAELQRRVGTVLSGDGSGYMGKVIADVIRDLRRYQTVYGMTVVPEATMVDGDWYGRFHDAAKKIADRWDKTTDKFDLLNFHLDIRKLSKLIDEGGEPFLVTSYDEDCLATHRLAAEPAPDSPGPDVGATMLDLRAQLARAEERLADVSNLAMTLVGAVNDLSTYQYMVESHSRDEFTGVRKRLIGEVRKYAGKLKAALAEGQS